MVNQWSSSWWLEFYSFLCFHRWSMSVWSRSRSRFAAESRTHQSLADISGGNAKADAVPNTMLNNFTERKRNTYTWYGNVWYTITRIHKSCNGFSWLHEIRNPNSSIKLAPVNLAYQFQAGENMWNPDFRLKSYPNQVLLDRDEFGTLRCGFCTSKYPKYDWPS